MKKFGFTLLEVLMTIGIIGIAAALTVPSVINNAKMNTNLSKLSKTVTDLENAFTSAIAAEHTVDVFSLSFWPNGAANGGGLTINSTQAMKNRFNGNFARYMKFNVTNRTVQDIYGGNNFHVLNNNGTTGGLWNDCNAQGVCRFRNNYPIQLANGSVVFFQLVPRAGRMRIGQADANGNMNYITETEAMRRGTSLRCETGWAFIDVNGPDAPNTLGRDIFVFVIGQDGHLYAYGGTEYANFEEGEINSRNWRAANGNYSCTNDRKSASGMACTGRVVEEGYRMTY